jgi:hypothetical protein
MVIVRFATAKAFQKRLGKRPLKTTEIQPPFADLRSPLAKGSVPVLTKRRLVLASKSYLLYNTSFW